MARGRPDQGAMSGSSGLPQGSGQICYLFVRIKANAMVFFFRDRHGWRQLIVQPVRIMAGNPIFSSPHILIIQK